MNSRRRKWKKFRQPTEKLWQRIFIISTENDDCCWHFDCVQSAQQAQSLSISSSWPTLLDGSQFVLKFNFSHNVYLIYFLIESQCLNLPNSMDIDWDIFFFPPWIEMYFCRSAIEWIASDVAKTNKKHCSISSKNIIILRRFSPFLLLRTNLLLILISEMARRKRAHNGSLQQRKKKTLCHWIIKCCMANINDSL